MIDAQGRLFGRINIIDLAVLLLVLLLAGRIAYGWFVQKPAVEQTLRPITFQVLVEKVRQPTADAFKVGDVVYDTRTNQRLGVLKAVEVRPAVLLKVNDDGTKTEVPSDIYREVLLTIEGPGQVTPTAVMVGPLQIHIGTPVKIQNAIWGVEGIVWKIEPGGSS
ncbi:MAG: DUF4330 domain-containing protein [Clostridiales bacterium]|nr:DUF4330 domain-containing protein [Clostridiales bacterium]